MVIWRILCCTSNLFFKAIATVDTRSRIAHNLWWVSIESLTPPDNYIFWFYTSISIHRVWARNTVGETLRNAIDTHLSRPYQSLPMLRDAGVVVTTRQGRVNWHTGTRRRYWNTGISTGDAYIYAPIIRSSWKRGGSGRLTFPCGFAVDTVERGYFRRPETLLLCVAYVLL